MKTTSPLRRCLLTLSLAFVLTSPAWSQDTAGLLQQALDLVHQVETPAGNPPTDPQRLALLTQAIKLAQNAPNHRLQGHRVLAIQALRVALATIRTGDPNHQASAYLRTADTELSTSIALADAAKAAAPTTNRPPLTNTPSATTPPVSPPTTADLPPPSPPQPPGNPVFALSPGVTTEMEQSFLTKYKTALQKQDTDALLSLVATDPAMDPKAKKDFDDLALFGFALTVSNPHRTYAFVPVTPGEHSQPTPMDGKMYDDYLPAVIALKITFGPPPSGKSSPDQSIAVGDNTTPLCVQNHQLMLIGLKEIPGAVPPPAIDKSANFGIEPNLRKVSDQAGFDRDAFPSLDAFLASLKQPRVQILGSGEAKFEYYAICRIAPNLCVWAGGDKAGEKNYSFYFKASDSTGAELKGSQKWIRLVDVPTDNGHAPNVQGTVFFVPDHYTGPITIAAQYTDDAANKTYPVSRTVDWK